MSIGLVAAGFLKKSQGIRGTPEEQDARMIKGLRGILYALENELTDGQYLIDIVHETWQRVKQRDWKANAATGVAP